MNLKRLSNNKIWVCNALNTTQYGNPSDCGCDGEDWIDYWQKKTGNEKKGECRACHKQAYPNSPIVGAHVMSITGGAHAYIVPMHKSCNSEQSNLDAFSVDINDLAPLPPDIENCILQDSDNIRERIRQHMKVFNRIRLKKVKK